MQGEGRKEGRKPLAATAKAAAEEEEVKGSLVVVVGRRLPYACFCLLPFLPFLSFVRSLARFAQV